MTKLIAQKKAKHIWILDIGHANYNSLWGKTALLRKIVLGKLGYIGWVEGWGAGRGKSIKYLNILKHNCIKDFCSLKDIIWRK